MPSAEIITIGTEILLGEIVDTNSRYIARQLRDIGIDIYRHSTVGDNVHRIAAAVQEALQRCEIVITTGGLGPTIDDPTRDAIALAANVETVYRSELWDQIVARFGKYGRKPTENNRRQAFIPAGAISVENPVGTAPAFITEVNNHSIIALPGVPREMEYLLQHSILDYLKERFPSTGIIKSRIIHTAGVGESQIDEQISDLEHLSNPTVGLAAHSGQVDIRITAKAQTETEALELIKPIEIDIINRLGDWVYGFDADTLEQVALQNLKHKGWNLVVVEAGLAGSLIRRLASASRELQGEYEGIFMGGESLTSVPSKEELLDISEKFHQSRGAEVCIGVSVGSDVEKININQVVISPHGVQQVSPLFGGPPEYAKRWALNHSLNALRCV